MLKRRQMIPPVTARTADGHVVQAWDYKQKRALVIAFLHAGCAECEVFLGRLAAGAVSPPLALSEANVARRPEAQGRQDAGDTTLAELEATALVVLPEPPPARLTDGLPPHIVLAADVSGRSQRAFLGKDAFDPRGQRLIGVFVTDRFGELAAQWCGGHESLPGVPDVLGWLHQVQIACEECGAPHWPSE